MPCCMAEKYGGWCLAVPPEDHVVYEGKEYCIFHAPAECPEKRDVEAFNEKVFARIDQAIENDCKCNCEGWIFPGEIKFNPNPDGIFPEINFSYATFNGDVIFRNENFTNKAYVAQNTYSYLVEIKTFSFRKAANFNYATFHGLTDFSYNSFHDIADFFHTIFNENVSFYHVIFMNIARFESTIFREQPIYDAVDFWRYTLFSSAQFRLPPRFTGCQFRGLTQFDLTGFSKGALFENCIFRKAVFNDSHFGKDGRFRHCQFGQANFDGALADGQLVFEDSYIRCVAWQGAPIEKLRFIACTWPESNGRKVFHDARLVDGKGYFPLDNVENPAPHEDESPSPSQLSDMFRRLKKVAKAESDELLASDWHYAEKEMQLEDLRQQLAEAKGKKGKNGWSLWFFAQTLRAYRSNSGYGESPQRAAIWLAALLGITLLFPVLSWGLAVLADHHVPNLFTGLNLLACARDTLADPSNFIPLVDMENTAHVGWVGRLFQGLWRFLVTVQAGFFAFALRNKMRR